MTGQLLPEDLDTPIKVQTLLETGVTYRQVDHWVRRGYFLRPGETRPATPGPGNPRSWTLREYAICALMVRFLRAGFEVATAAEWARDSVDHGRDSVTTEDGITVAWGAA